MEGGGVRPLPKNRFVRGLYLMLRRYLNHNVAIESAALAFYLLFTIFPLLIFLNALLGLLNIDLTAMLNSASRFLPPSVTSFLQVYLNHIGRTSNVRLLLFGLFFSLYFPMRATNSLMRSVRTAYHLGPPHRALRHTLNALFYTMTLIVTIVLSLTLMTVGNLALTYAIEHFGLPVYAATLWERLRFPAMALLMFLALYLLYAMTQDERQPIRNLWPGAVASLVGWVVLSWFYSYYVENLAAYSVLYGSIGTVIVLMIWLYLTAVVLIMGAEFNGTLISLRKDHAADEPEP